MPPQSISPRRIWWRRAWVALSSVTACTASPSASRPDADSAVRDAVSSLDRPADRDDGARVSDVPDVATTRDRTEARDDGTAGGCDNDLVRCEGACVDLTASRDHCGACGQRCPAPPRTQAQCVAGACHTRCEPGFGDCDGDDANGCEADLASRLHCGACGARCDEPTPVCDAARGASHCASGCGDTSLRCAGACVDPQTNVEHCGRCRNECPTPRNGRAICVDGACRFVCDATAHACGGQCVPNDAVDTCGARCEPCPVTPQARAVCDGGACGLQCNNGWSDCDGDRGNGCEVESRTSLLHCGACDRSCEAAPHGAAVCVDGRCAVSCTPPYGNCDGDPRNGCEARLDTDVTCGHCLIACASAATCVRSTCAPCSAFTPAESGRAEVDDAASLRLGDVSFTVEAWLFATGYPNRCHHAVASKRGATSRNGWMLAVTGAGCFGGQPRLRFQVSRDDDPAVEARVDAPLGRWFHAAATFQLDTGMLTLWQDGVAVGAGVVPAPDAAASAPMFLGNDGASDAATWRGHLDDLRIAQGVRYAAGFTPAPFAQMESGTIALWRFQAPTAIDVDASSRGYVAFLRNARTTQQAAHCRR